MTRRKRLPTQSRQRAPPENRKKIRGKPRYPPGWQRVPLSERAAVALAWRLRQGRQCEELAGGTDPLLRRSAQGADHASRDSGAFGLRTANAQIAIGSP